MRNLTGPNQRDLVGVGAARWGGFCYRSLVLPVSVCKEMVAAYKQLATMRELILP